MRIVKLLAADHPDPPVTQSGGQLAQLPQAWKRPPLTQGSAEQQYSVPRRHEQLGLRRV